MTDVILSSFISLFALFGKVEQVDEERAKIMLVNYLRHHFGIRNTDLYVDLYSDMRMAYEMTDDLNTIDTVTAICSNLQTDIRNTEKALLLQTSGNMATSDILGVYVYSVGIAASKAQYSYASAIGLCLNVINFAIIMGVNGISRRMSDISLF